MDSRKLDTFSNMVSTLEKSRSRNPSRRAKKHADGLVASFENNMDDDLNVKAAFDAIYSAVRKLDDLRRKGRLSAKDARDVIIKLRRIDSVIRVIF